MGIWPAAGRSFPACCCIYIKTTRRQKHVAILARETRAGLQNIVNAFVYGLDKLDPAHVAQEMCKARERLRLPWIRV
jgi:hypothetical protein